MRKWASIIFFIISLTITLILIFRLNKYHNSRSDTSISQGKKISKELSQSIDSSLTDVMFVGQEIAKKLSTTRLEEDSLIILLKKHSKEIPSILGITAAFEPYQYDKSKKLFAPYYDKHKNSIIYIEDVYDYTIDTGKSSQWYVKVRDDGAMWVEPYYAEGAQTIVADYGIPIRKKTDSGEITIGTVTMTISLKKFTELIKSLSLGKTGYGFVVSKKGIFLAHPVEEYVGRKSLKDLYDKSSIEKHKSSYQKIAQESKGFITIDDNNEENYIFFNQIKSTGWKIAVVFSKNDILGKPANLKNKYIDICLSGGFTIIFLWVLLFGLYRFEKRHIWNLSIIVSIVLLANLLLLWHFQHTMDSSKNGSVSPPITDITKLKRFVNLQKIKAHDMRIKKPYIVPTGIYIRRLDFDDAYNVNISGNIWQKYDTTIIEKVEPGVLFSQTSPFAEASYIKEAYRKKIDGHVLIGWFFRLTLRMNFDYKDFPFEKRNINIELSPSDFDKGILLTPDLNSYESTTPNKMAGIDKRILLPGNKLLESYFNYIDIDFPTDFGFQEKEFSLTYPSLYFNINIRRDLINPFVSYMIPIFVVLLMMYILMFSSSKSASVPKGVPQGVGIVESLAAFFFVLIFSHIDLRKSVETSQMMYLEYFFIILYFMLLISVFNLISFTRRDGVLFFDYEDNLIAKVTYWPMFLLVVYVISLYTFY